ncbi:putative methyltransferase-like protein C27D7.08c [Hypsizygus marmoreus]|uniref:Methyltransferase-like protein C27D7.08c n=1 Tax=Hypsizygus marmoreus TaxID=39966 RepID=A0A369JUY7_HYPMA|nr:putative methyltransferase-like protein C27D7.08c [Hypsizygus marmoreus]
MHPRNPYHNAPDFESLAHSYPPLLKHLKGQTINFHDDAAQRCLTQALLKRDFDLEITLPSDRLCPPVPNRLNYVLWIQDIVRAHADGVLGSGRLNVRGLDIGTGASAIYPLLACRLEPEWTFVATEIDQHSFDQAQTNVASNGLTDRIRVVKVEHPHIDASSPAQCEVSTEDGDEMPMPNEGGRGLQAFGFNQLFANRAAAWSACNSEPKTMADADLMIEFTMCNPPFYSSAADVLRSEEGKEAGPFGVCTGAPVEMITPGGEARFVNDMVRESVLGTGLQAVATHRAQPASQGDDSEARARKRRRVGTPDANLRATGFSPAEPPTIEGTKTLQSRWYTSMLGKLSSVSEVVDTIKAVGITNYAITEFVQGPTRRWAVGWSLGKWRLGDEIARIPNPNPTLQRLLPPRNTLRLPAGPQGVEGKLREVLAGIDGVSMEVRTEDRSVSYAGTSAEESPSTGVKIVARAQRDTWSRSARRKRQKGESAPHPISQASSVGVGSASNASDPALICTVVANGNELEFRWVYGGERALFESFASHVGKKVGTGG